MIRKRLTVLTGLSGSGKSSAARALEDEGFFVVDNLPVTLLPKFLEVADRSGEATTDLAVVVDIRSRDFFADFRSTMDDLRQNDLRVEIYFFDASDETLVRRFSETRRRHPLAREHGLLQAIDRERHLLQGLREMATAVVDSSVLNPHQLRARTISMVRGEKERAPLVVQLQSFGYRHGVPPESDLVMDIRFLPNPHFVPELQPRSGLDRPVSEFVLAQPACREFLGHFRGLLQFLLPHYRQEGKSYLTISIGCTGGRHRSVAIVEELRPALAGEHVTLEVNHRDLNKG